MVTQTCPADPQIDVQAASMVAALECALEQWALDEPEEQSLDASLWTSALHISYVYICGPIHLLVTAS